MYTCESIKDGGIVLLFELIMRNTMSFTFDIAGNSVMQSIVSYYTLLTVFLYIQYIFRQNHDISRNTFQQARLTWRLSHRTGFEIKVRHKWSYVFQL